MNHQIAHPGPQHRTPEPHFTALFSSTPRGARLARRLAAQQLADWGVPYGSDLAERATLVVAELATNAVTHGRVPGRDFRLALLFREAGRTLRIEVTDTRPDRLPPRPDPVRALPEQVEVTATGGRGLVIVDSLTSTWGVDVSGNLTKVVWAELRAG
ncbi:ATP-binding protein [Streptomyces sp. NPDC102381]|uniref:ATP-binding protein n=1 Tax=Streptomyces sp. NPDC102381 TaxID=3366164 RepID=UPI00382BE89E